MHDFVMGEPLDSSMSNDDAYRLGMLAREAASLGPAKCGDEIDRGLILCRLMREKGYRIVKDPDHGEVAT
jgi:hypothetical protein